MNQDKNFEKLLSERISIADKLSQQEETILSLDSYKKTFIKCLCGNNLIYTFPSELESNNQRKVMRINDRYPLIVLNFGFLPYSKNINTSLPNYFRSLRKFIKVGAEDNYTWYTSTAIRKKNGYFFIIQDDENNKWQGNDAFNEFSSCFDNPIPFKNVHEWLGFGYEEVRRNYSTEALKQENHSLDSFFTKSF